MRWILSQVTIFFLAACGAVPERGYVQLEPDQFREELSKGNGKLVDVRTTREFDSGHINGSELINWKDSADFFAAAQKLEKTEPLYLYCKSGGRSAKAASWLVSQGFEQVYELKGGIENWQSAGLPIEP